MPGSSHSIPRRRRFAPSLVAIVVLASAGAFAAPAGAERASDLIRWFPLAKPRFTTG